MDCRAATSKICQQVLGRTDYQLGKNKVFLKDSQDLFLEQERDRVLTKKILILQRSIKAWYHRRRSATDAEERPDTLTVAVTRQKPDRCLTAVRKALYFM